MRVRWSWLLFIVVVYAAAVIFCQWYQFRTAQLRDETIRVLEQRVMEANRALARCDSLSQPLVFDTTGTNGTVMARVAEGPALGKVTLSGDTLFVGLLTCTVPSTEQALGQCAGNGVPDSGASFARIQLRANHPDSVWRDGWTVGMSQAAGRSIVFPITGIRSATWARLAPVDTAGNQACWSDSALLVPHVVVP